MFNWLVETSDVIPWVPDPRFPVPHGWIDVVLEALNLTGEYEIIECDPDLADTTAFCEH